MQSSTRNISLKKFILSTLYILSFSVLMYYIYDGYSYYITPFMERPHHIDHQSIKPGGIQGHGLGILGTMMMLFLLVYSLRKKTLSLKGLAK
jgi:hypothetical protein